METTTTATTTPGASAGATLLFFLVIGALWGCTNPLIKRGAGPHTAICMEARGKSANYSVRLPSAVAGSSTELMYARRDNSPRELATQALHLVKNWRVMHCTEPAA